MKRKGQGAGQSTAPQMSGIQAGKLVMTVQHTDKAAHNAISIFGKVISSLPFSGNRIQFVSGREVFDYRFHDQVLEFSVTAIAEKTQAPNTGKRSERSRRTGFDLLRFTLNLARGDLEQHSLVCI